MTNWKQEFALKVLSQEFTGKFTDTRSWLRKFWDEYEVQVYASLIIAVGFTLIFELIKIRASLVP